MRTQLSLKPVLMQLRKRLRLRHRPGKRHLTIYPADMSK